MLGRAGRPRYDSVGDAWLIARHLEHADDIAELYFEQDPEAVESKLAADPAMRVHVLASIATGGQRDRDAIGRFFQQVKISVVLGLHGVDIGDLDFFVSYQHRVVIHFR